jgi:hypothetical protein
MRHSRLQSGYNDRRAAFPLECKRKRAIDQPRRGARRPAVDRRALRSLPSEPRAPTPRYGLPGGSVASLWWLGAYGLTHPIAPDDRALPSGAQEAGDYRAIGRAKEAWTTAKSALSPPGPIVYNPGVGCERGHDSPCGRSGQPIYVATAGAVGPAGPLQVRGPREVGPCLTGCPATRLGGSRLWRCTQVD